jgi:glycosyltransferase involved in cell wall biosynthesis
MSAIRTSDSAVARALCAYPWSLMGFLLLCMVVPKLYELTYLFWVGRVSANALGIAEQHEFLSIAIEVINESTAVGILSLVAQASGRRNEVLGALRAGLFVALVGSSLLTIMLWIAPQACIRVMGTPPALVSASCSYLRLRACGLPFDSVGIVLLTALKALGRARQAVAIVFAGMLLNAVLDVLTISDTRLSLHLGISGMAIGFVLSRAATCILAAVACKRAVGIRGGDLFTGLTRFVGSLPGFLSTGGWAGMDSLVRNLGYMAMLTVLNALGTQAFAAYGLAMTIIWTAILPILALTEGTNIVIGNLFGQRRQREMEQTLLVSLVLALMKILKVIHGYPMRYNAGSEVYTQTLCHGSRRATRSMSSRARRTRSRRTSALRTEVDCDDPRVTSTSSTTRAVGPLPPRWHRPALRRGPRPRAARGRSRRPPQPPVDVPAPRGSAREIPIVFTLHDYWVMCPRGQFMQMHPEDPDNLWAACDGQEDRKCAERCYARYFSGTPDERRADVALLDRLGLRRMRHVREMTELVDLFIAPARYLLAGTATSSACPKPSSSTSTTASTWRGCAAGSAHPGEPFTFGYIGTHIPAKGIHDLIRCVRALRGDSRLRIWGRPRGQDTEALKGSRRPPAAGVAARVEWLPEYRTRRSCATSSIACDAIVVPSVWVENSPLVIHEAQQARVPVITADVGGMAEYVRPRGERPALRATAIPAALARRCSDSSTTRRSPRSSVRAATYPVRQRRHPSIAEHVTTSSVSMRG